jgi:dienelactone hydrolase
LAAQVSDEVFQAYRINFEYDRKPLNADVRKVGSDRLMQHELIEIDSAYSSPRLPIHLYLPENASPPYQIVVYWPGGIAVELARYEDFKFQFDFLLKSGRAVAFPIYYSAFGRVEPQADTELTGTAALRDVVIRSIKDLRRTVDYLESRPDIDGQKIAYFGNSWGAKYGLIGLSVDSRFRTSVLYTLSMAPNPSPDIDPASFFRQVRTPVLLIGGQYDPFISHEDAQTAYELLGTTEEDKRLVIAPSAHYAPFPLLVRETLAWYDSYLGIPVR